MLFTKEQVQKFYNSNNKAFQIDSCKNKAWFVLKITSKKFKKLYKLKWENKQPYLVEKYGYDLLLHKAMKYVRLAESS
jgi:hypothetical protein